MVAAVDMRGKRGLVFASEQGGSLGCYTAKGLARRIDYIPLALDFAFFAIYVDMLIPPVLCIFKPPVPRFPAGR